MTYHTATPSTSVSATLVESTLADGNDGLLLVDTVSGERNLLGNFASGAWLGGAQIAVEGTIQQNANPVSGLHIIDVNNLSEPPFTVLSLAEGVRLLDYVRLPDGTLRALTQQRDPGEIRVVDTPMSGGLPEVVGNAGYLVQPRLSPDGSRVAGLMHPAGALLLHNVRTSNRIALSNPSRVTRFRWR